MPKPINQLQKEADIIDYQQYEKWLICVDPKSQLFYTVNCVTNEMHIETDADDFMIESAKKAIEDLKQIVDYEKSSWLFESEQAKRFQRRKIPSYLLNKDSSEYPTYILIQSFISFCKFVLLGNYEEKLKEWKQEPPINLKKVDVYEGKEDQPLKYEKRIDIEVRLVTGQINLFIYTIIHGSLAQTMKIQQYLIKDKIFENKEQ